MFLLCLFFLSVFANLVPQQIHPVESESKCGLKCKLAVGVAVTATAVGVTNKLTNGNFFRRLSKGKFLKAFGLGTKTVKTL